MTHPNSHTPDKQWPSMPACIPDISSDVADMDRQHHDLFHALHELTSSKDHEFGPRYAEFVSKVERTLRTEEQWMEEFDFPEFASHQEQHARVLGALHNIHSQVMNGELGLGRKLAEELLPQWLAFHISAMNAVFTAVMQLTRGGHELTPELS